MAEHRCPPALADLDLGTPFALLSRAGAEGDGLELLVLEHRDGADLLDVDGTTATLTVVPYREIRRRGLDAVDDGTPLLVFDVRASSRPSVAELLARVADVDRSTAPFRLVPDDAAFAARVDEVVGSCIASGDGANFVLHRELVADLGEVDLDLLLRAFAVLVQRERGSHWTFLVWTGHELLLGASPEPHVSVDGGVAAMTPISGTLTSAGAVATEAEVVAFLTNAKETDELAMVLDEELKMMTAVCHEPPVVTGPSVREMAHVLHTEFRIEGPTRLAPGEVLAATLLAPTIIGSPLSSACRVVAEESPQGRGYYGGVLALAEPDGSGRPRLDSCILIRTARVDLDGRLRAAVGATVVRHSTGAGEAEETRGKSRALQEALTGALASDEAPTAAGDLAGTPVVRILEDRGRRGAAFWRQGSRGAPSTPQGLARVVDAGDDFSRMIAAQLQHLGWTCEIVRSTRPPTTHDVDLLVLGPGPGDPRDGSDPVIVGARRWAEAALADRVPTVAVCLSHQMVGSLLGCATSRLASPHQGRPRPVDLLGVATTAGFYNSFGLRVTSDLAPGVDAVLDEDGVVVALLGPTVTTLQFHPESFLTADGPELLRRATTRVTTAGHLARPASHRPATARTTTSRRRVLHVASEGDRSA